MARPPAPEQRSRRRRGLRVAALAVAGLVVALLILAFAAYGLRGAIGARLAAAYLKAHGVPADIQVQRLDASGFTARVRLGPAADPDLTVEQVQVEFAPGPLFSHGLAVPRLRSVRLLRPDLKAAYDGKRVSFGSLQPLIDQLTRGPSAGPPPDITAEQGRVRLATPAGAVTLTGDARLQAGRLQALSARLAPARLAANGLSADITGAALALRAVPSGLDGTLQLAAGRLAAKAGAASALRLDAGWTGPDLPLSSPGVRGPATLRLSARADAVQANGARLVQPVLGLSFQGRVDAGAQGLAARGDLTGGLPAASASAAGASFQARAAELTLKAASLAVRGGRAEVAAPLTGRVTAARITQGDIALSQATWSGRGEVRAGQAVSADLRGGLSARSAVSAATAARLAAAVPVAGMEPPGRAALARAIATAALSAPDLRVVLAGPSLTLSAGAPLRVSGADGASVVVTPRPGAPLMTTAGQGARGGLDLAVGGRGLPALKASVPDWRLGPGGAWRADASFGLGFETAMFRQARLDGAARIASDGAAVTVAPAGCLKVATAAVTIQEPPLVTAVEAQLCPRPGAPFLVARGGGWALKADARDGRFDAPQTGTQVRAIAAFLDLSGAGSASPQGVVTVTQAVAQDSSPQKLFLPIRASGRLASAGPLWQGGFELVDAAHGRPFAKVAVRHDMTSGAGEARIDASDLVFASKGLQPGDVLPMFRTLAGQAQGHAAFTGALRWTQAGLTSEGRLVTTDLGFGSAAGRVGGLHADLRFSSLAPLVVAGDQTVTVDTVAAISPLTGVSATFAMDAAALQLRSASAKVAGGEVTLAAMTVPFAEGSTIKGALAFKDIDLGAMVAGSSLSDRVLLTARIDGDLAFTLGPEGFHVVSGQLAANGPGRLSILPAALGQPAPTTAAAAPGAAPSPAPGPMQDLAYQALRDLAFDKLDATLAPQPKGRLGALFHITGRHDPPVDPKPTISVLDVIRGHGFDKPIPLPKGTPINLTLDTSLNFDELLKDYLDAFAGGSAKVQP